jgi:hypothetical protein
LLKVRDESAAAVPLAPLINDPQRLVDLGASAFLQEELRQTPVRRGTRPSASQTRYEHDAVRDERRERMSLFAPTENHEPDYERQPEQSDYRKADDEPHPPGHLCEVWQPDRECFDQDVAARRARLRSGGRFRG